MQEKQKVAFFDIDGTLFRWSLFIDYTEKMMEKGILPSDLKEKCEHKKKLWLQRELEFDDYLICLIKAFEQNIAGVKVDDFLKIVKESVKEKRKRVYRFTRDLIFDLKKKNYFLVAVSHSGKMAVDEFLIDFPFDKVYGLMLEIDNGVFTGNILSKDEIFDKGKIVERVIEKHNLTLKDSFAVGDTESDIKMLEKVENPIAFNPDKKLYEYAKNKNWKTIVERKNVIYTINP